LAELIVILELHQQGMTVSAIARRTGLHRSTVAKYIARGIEPPVYGPRPARPTKLTPFERYLRERIAAVPELTGSRLYRELREMGYAGGYTVLKDFLRQVRPRPTAGFEIRFETPAGHQAQVDFAHFRTVFTDESGAERIVWLFSLVLGHSRMMWGRFVLHQDMQTLLRCHADAFADLGGVPTEILYDRMRTVFHRDDTAGGHIVHNATLRAFAAHYSYQPKACRPYRAQTKGKVERPYRYVRDDFFLGGSFRNLEDLNLQFRALLFHDTELVAARAERSSPVASTEPSDAAKAKKATKRSAEGHRIMCFADLIDYLGHSRATPCSCRCAAPTALPSTPPPPACGRLPSDCSNSNPCVSSRRKS
jgi:transposase